MTETSKPQAKVGRMGFESNEYLSWYLPRVRGESAKPAINLHASGMPALSADELAPTAGEPWSMAGRFEAALGEWLGIPAEEVVFTSGATGGTLLALLCLARPGSAVLIESSMYEPMRRQAERLNHVRRLPRSIDDAWRVDPASADLGGEVAMVLITEPQNPSGIASPREAVLELAARCADAGAVLLINEVYRGFTDAPSYHGTAESTVVVSSLSKLCGAYAARLGWLSARPEICVQLRQGLWNASVTPGPTAAAGVTVMQRIDELAARARETSRAGVGVVDDWVGATPGLEWHRPDVGFGCVRLPQGIGDLALAERLHDEHGVLVVPGTLWEAPGTLRISWLQAGEQLRSGLERIGTVLAGR